MTLNEAKQLNYGDIIYDSSAKNADGTAVRYKVNGQPKTWKRNELRVRVPLKHGLYSYGYMTEVTLGFYCIEEPVYTKAK